MARYLEYYAAQSGGSRGSGIPHVFVGSQYQRGHGIGSFLGGLFRRVLPYLIKGARAVGKEALRAGVNVFNDVANDTPLKSAVRTRLRESHGNLKKQAAESVSKLMNGSGYKVSAKIKKAQFPLEGLAGYIAATSSSRKRRKSVCKAAKAAKGKTRGRRRRSASANKSGKKSTSRKRKKRVVRKRIAGTKKRRTASDIFS